MYKEYFTYTREHTCENNCCCCPYFCFTDYNYTQLNNLTYYKDWEVSLKYLFSTFLCIFGSMGNATIIFILLKNKLLLRSTINHFILSMCFADFILAIIGPMQFAIKDTSTFWPFSEYWCKLDGSAQSKLSFLFHMHTIFYILLF